MKRRAFLTGVTGAALLGPALADFSPAMLPAGGVSRFAEVNGVRLHYVVAGVGPTVVLLHGWPQTWLAWKGAMERLAARFTLIAPDLRGVGLSERTPAGYDKRTIAADIAALIADVAGGRAHVVGHDMGGKAAFVLAHLYPLRVEKLVLVDCLLPGTENMDAAHGGAWHYGFHMAPDIPELLTKGREREYIAAQIRAWSHRKDAVSEASIAEFSRHYATPGGMTAGFALYRALPEDARLAASLAGNKLAMPVMTIAGRHGVGPRLAEAVGRQASDLTAEIAEDSGHFVAEEAPEFFCDRLARFLAS
ncbi:alpha/beta fold hydrolase [Methylosinus sp. Sm6]|uniref:alpha/beta fold hydrolase n=1 Tax=Methylosinus sp. Sm6 TaxID=2866948 RepID=UPI001C98FFD5|nr:alpha/beta hydrolase [Methylosinus sp. Sm6]MBY6242225.1 alpha/beta hydrolase [Methylosinus sp. Sm6]